MNHDTGARASTHTPGGGTWHRPPTLIAGLIVPSAPSPFPHMQCENKDGVGGNVTCTFSVLDTPFGVSLDIEPW